MSTTPDRRILIAEAALDLIAREGLRALTHRAVDRDLDLPAGSSSYYFRSRGALLDAAVRRLAQNSRDAFTRSGLEAPERTDDVDASARAVATTLDEMLLNRRRDLLVRYALAVDPTIDPELHALLATGLFSRDAATTLMAAHRSTQPANDAADFVGLVEGLVADRLIGARSRDGIRAGTADSVEQLARSIAVFLRGLPTESTGTRPI